MFPKNRNTWANKSYIYTLTSATYQNTTLYVRTTGSDANNGLSVSNALLTIQEAINRIPKYVRHNVTIDIGVGTFAPFYLDGFIQESGLFIITGTLGDPTLASGTVSGTSTGGTTTTLTDAGQAWTNSNLIGHLLLVGGEYRVIFANTNDTIDVIGAFSAPTNGKAYHIYQPKTVINGESTYTESTDGSTFNASIFVRNSNFIDGYISRFRITPTNNANNAFYCLESNGISVKENFFDGFNAGVNTQYGITLKYTNKVNLYDNYIRNHYYGFYSDKSFCGNIYRNYCISNNDGFCFVQSNAGNCQYLTAVNGNNDGFQILDDSTYVVISNIIASSNSANGVTNYGNLTISGGTIGSNVNGIVVGNSTGTVYGRLTISAVTTIQSNTSDGIVGWDNAFLNVRYAQGVNTGYGVRCKNCNTLIHSTGNTTIIGAVNTYTLDDGVTPATDWTTNFVANNDSVVELTTNTLAVRRD
jgi:hypothetical protein